jgi:hypothetical protein
MRRFGLLLIGGWLLLGAVLAELHVRSDFPLEM